MKVGTEYLGDGKCKFTVWAPNRKNVKIEIRSPSAQTASLEKIDKGYWQIELEDITPETRYIYLLDDERRRPDPASHFQPETVHGDSQVIDHSEFRWESSTWNGIPPEQMIVYELHVGTFTPDGTFGAIPAKLPYLKQLGVNAIEIMPVAQFPGSRNWGYDGVYPYAVQNSYGGPYGLKTLVNACHREGLAVVLDVVYNHLGPEGNYLREFGPYFTKKYKTPWGEALNFDGPCSDEVRNFFIENALFWFREYHIDALRLDAIHAIYDMSARPFLQELADAVRKFSRETGWERYLIAESNQNDHRIIRPAENGGLGLDAVWNDDFHHSVHTLLTAEKAGYYMDFGKSEHLAKALREGFVYSWDYSKFRKRRHGNSSRPDSGKRFVVCIQNHDQVGNRMMGDRLSALVPFEALKLAAGVMLLSPYIPLLFMGEEYGEEAPFLYFVSHGDPNLIEAVRKGRKAEFSDFEWRNEPPDPQAEDTFLKSKLRWESIQQDKHQALLNYYRQLIRLRKEHSALAGLNKDCVKIMENNNILQMKRWDDKEEIQCLMNFSDAESELALEQADGKWGKILDAADEQWAGPGSAIAAEVEFPAQLSMPPFGFLVLWREKN